MSLPRNKTKLVCTIGPASEQRETMEEMIRAGMNVARLNLSHGDFESHQRVIENLRIASQNAGRSVALMADLPGPKIRIGRLAEEPVELEVGASFVLTTKDIMGDAKKVSVSFSRLAKVVSPGDRLYINDGIIQLNVLDVKGDEVHCQVRAGGILRSRKGLNLPGIDLGISAFTDRDRECLAFAKEQQVDAVSQSFVETAADVIAVRGAATDMGYRPFIIAKIERAGALKHIEEILHAADGIMVARGDLGVEIPIEEIAVIQKQLSAQANRRGKPVITATQMLESMMNNSRPTRAEATDVANAILDGADCVMLSGESALGKYPVGAVAMLAKVAAAIEPTRARYRFEEALRDTGGEDDVSLADLIALSVEATCQRVSPAAVVVPTKSGYTARNIARFRLPVWITAVSSSASTCQGLLFSYGVHPVFLEDHPEDWKPFIDDWMRSMGVSGDLVVLTEGPSRKHPETNNRMELIDLARDAKEAHQHVKEYT